MATVESQILELLKKRNIKCVVYVDNEFEKDLYKEPFIRYIRQNIGTDEMEFPFPSEGGIDIVLQEFSRWWEHEDENGIKKECQQRGIGRATSEVESKLLEILPCGILKCLTPAEYEAVYSDYDALGLSENNQLLVLMDMYLSDDDPSSGMRKLTSVKNKDWVSCGLFSNKFDVHHEIDNWSESDTVNNIYPLSKSRVMEGDTPSLLQGLHNVLWLRQITDVKNKAISLYEESLNKTIEKIGKLDPASFDHVVIRSSHIEGCWEFDTIKRILQTIHNRYIELLLLSDDNFEKIQVLTGMLKEMSPLCDGAAVPNSETLRVLYKSEVYDDVEYVNRTYSQIANGDIFNINGKGNFMLVCQPCNLELRGDSSRKSSEFVYMLPINEINQGAASLSHDYLSILQPIQGESLKCVNLARNVRVSPKVLDIVCFNKEGKSVIDIEVEAKDLDGALFMQDNLLSRYDNIRQEVNRYVTLCNLVSGFNNDIMRKEQKNQLLKILKKPFELATNRIVIPNYDAAHHRVDFGIVRVGRYKGLYAQTVLQDFMGYLSRQALPNDFSKMTT